jgi:transposase-like protein
MRKQYSDAFIEQALIKVYSRGDRTIESVAEEVNVGYQTLKNWVKRKSLDDVTASAAKEKRPQDWRRDEQLAALMETHGLSEEALQAWCRERGIFPHHLDSWKIAFCTQGPAAVSDGRDLRILRAEHEDLKKELNRKEKALAEAAALLVLQKKFRALWDNEDK